MKKAFSLVLLIALAAGVFGGFLFAEEPVHAQTLQLKVYNWGDYMDTSIIEEFEQEYEERTGNKLDIIYSLFETNEEMMTKVIKGEASVDLICPSEYAIEQLMRANALQKLDFTKIPNKANVDERIYTKVDAVLNDITINGTTEKMSDYFVPYMWGTLGILYNKTIVSREDAYGAGYGLLWNSIDNSKLDGKIYMKDSIRDAYVAAVLYLKETDRLPSQHADKTIGELINTVDDAMLKAAEEVLKEQKDVLHSYEVDFGKNEMVEGKGYVDLAWSGDAMYAMSESKDLDYFVPEIGGNIWFDGWVIPKNAPNAAVAHEFINFLCRPSIGIRNSMEIGYTCAISVDALLADADALAIIEENEYDVEEFFADELRYPDIDDEKFGVMKDFGAKNTDVVAMWERVKAHGNKTWVLIVVIVGIIVVAGSVVTIFIVKNKKGNKRRAIKCPASRPISKPIPAELTPEAKEDLEKDKKEE